jgi:hypothetical protein
MNIYLPITWLKYINEVNIGFGVFGFICLFLLVILFSIKPVKSWFHKCLGKFQVFLNIEFWILPITAGFFGLTPNAYNFFDVVFDEFYTKEYSYKNCMINKISKSITLILLVVAWIFTSSFLKGLKTIFQDHQNFTDLYEWIQKKFTRFPRRKLILIIVIGAILI